MNYYEEYLIIEVLEFELLEYWRYLRANEAPNILWSTRF